MSVTRDERISSLLVGKDRHRSRHLTRPCSTWDTRYLDPRTTYRAAIDTTRTFPPSLCPDLTIKENHPGTRLSPSSRVANIPTHYRNPDTFRHHTQRVGCARGVEGNAHSPRGVVGQSPTATQHPDLVRHSGTQHPPQHTTTYNRTNHTHPNLPVSARHATGQHATRDLAHPTRTNHRKPTTQPTCPKPKAQGHPPQDQHQPHNHQPTHAKHKQPKPTNRQTTPTVW